MNTAIHILKVTTLNKNIDLLNLAAGEFSRATQYTEDSLSLEIENVFVGKGQHVAITGELCMDHEKFKFESLAEIIHCEVITESLVQFQFRLYNHDQELWKNFMNSKMNLQNRLDHLLQKLKG